MSNTRSNRPAQAEVIRPGIVPGILGSAAALVGLFIAIEWFITIQFIVAILAAIMAVFAIQSKGWRMFVFVPLFVVIVVVYNPIFPLTQGWSGQAWQVGQVATGAVFFLAAFLLKTPLPKR